MNILSSSASPSPDDTHPLRLLKRRAAAVAGGVPRGSDFAIRSTSGATLNDVDGRRIIDLASGIWVMSAGHSRATTLAASAAQAAALQHMCIHTALQRLDIVAEAITLITGRTD